MTRMPTKEELVSFAYYAADQQRKALQTIELNGFVFDTAPGGSDAWQNLAFSLYTQLVRINQRKKELFDDENGG